MDRRTSTLLVFCAVVALLAGCSLFRWSGYRDRDPERLGEWSAAELVVSTSPAKPRAAPLPIVRIETLPPTLYYSDLGPEEIDVSDYTAQQKYNYAIFRRECSACHTLARAVNSPTQSRAYWRFHLARMSLHSRVNRAGPLPHEDVKRILDFLEYDSRIRKVQNRKEFDDRTETLKRRFDPTLERLLEETR